MFYNFVKLGLLTHHPSNHHYTKFFQAVPSSFAEAILLYGNQIMTCDSSEWEKLPFEGRAVWLLTRFQEENNRLRLSVASANRQLQSYRDYHNRRARHESDYLPYEEED